MANSLIDGDGKLNVRNYNEKVRKQRETFAQIDLATSILETLPDFVDTTMDVINANSFPFSRSPLGFIFNIIHSLGVSEETLKEWIVNILVRVLPEVEIGVKATLLANIKSMISCNADPRIPLWMRKKVSDSVYTNVLTGLNEERGIDINLDVIDPEGTLDLSPFTEPGKNYYFGNNTLNNLVRADDFNAFLWYVIHKGNKHNPIKASTGTDDGWKTFNVSGDDTKYYITSSNSSMLGPLEIRTQQGEESNIVGGNTFYDSEGSANNISMCIEAKRNKQFDYNPQTGRIDNGIITGNTIVPVSSDWFSLNWYVDKSNYYSSNLGYKSKKEGRNYSEEKAICNLRYYDWNEYEGSDIPPLFPYTLRFTILPKPYVLLPTAGKETYTDNKKIHVQWRPIRLLFDADGTPNQKGKFSLISETYDLQPTLMNKQIIGDKLFYDVYGIDASGAHIKATVLEVDMKTGKYEISKSGTFEKTYKTALVECYPGLTVYEFNYDYIMGMKLFNPKVVCQRIFDNAANPRFDADFVLTLNKQKDKRDHPYLGGRQRVLEIVRSILEEDDDEINDCFYSFSNEQYDDMLRKTEEIRYRQMPYNQGYNKGESLDFSEVNAILGEYPVNGTLEEQKDVIHRAITSACAILDDSSNTTIPSDRSTTKIDFLTNILQQLVAAIVDALLSPKVIMLLMVNKTLMEPEDSEGKDMFNTEDLLRLMNNLIKSVVREIRELIIQKLMDYIIEHLTPLALQLQARVLSEQFAAYIAIIKLLLADFNMGVITVSRLSSILSSMLSKFRKKNNTKIDLPSVLDDVTYADIYPTDEKETEPIINDC